MEPFASRQKQVLSQLPQEFEAILITNLTNVRYLCGFTGSAGWLLLDRKKPIFFTDFRYQQQSAEQIRDLAEIKIFKGNLIDAIGEYLAEKRLHALAVENSITIEHWESIKKVIPKLKYFKGLTEKVRHKKDGEELAKLRKAFAIADKAFSQILRFLKPGRTEIEIAAKLEYIMRKLGSEGASFPTIVASGERASCPHAQPTDKKLNLGEMVKIDFGAVVDGYHSDMTRTVFLGKADKKFKKIYQIVLNAQKMACSAIKPGIDCKEVDKIARDFITENGYGENFGHGLGHSIGLDIHESPALSPKSQDKIEEGMVFTVEPGIYIENWGGVRIEDVFVVLPNGIEKLTNTPNSLIEIQDS